MNVNPELNYLHSYLPGRLSQWMNIKENNIQDLQISPHTETELSVKYYVESGGGIQPNLAVNSLSQKIKNRLANFHHNGTRFQAEPRTLSLTHHYEDKTPSPDARPSTAIIVIVVIAAVASVTSLIIATVLCLKARRGGYEVSQAEQGGGVAFRNASYEKDPEPVVTASSEKIQL
jgi:hypothetical protein